MPRSASIGRHSICSSPFRASNPACRWTSKSTASPPPSSTRAHGRRDGAEICVKLGFGKEETHGLSFAPAASCGTDLARRQLWEGDGRDAPPAEIGAAGRTLLVSPGAPFGGFAGHAMRCVVDAPRPLARASLAQTCDGPLFTDYTLALRYGEDGRYTVDYRCFKSEPYVEIRETFSLGPGAEMRLDAQSRKRFTHILSRDSFEGERTPHGRNPSAKSILGTCSAVSRCPSSPSTSSRTTAAGSRSSTSGIPPPAWWVFWGSTAHGGRSPSPPCPNSSTPAKRSSGAPRSQADAGAGCCMPAPSKPPTAS
ncbi:MAG: hypothetical protein ACOX5G_01270 [Kiritimatiellia bacterium]|jgi:hypothetical protein